MDSGPASEQEFQAAEQRVELLSADLKKELRLMDLVGIQILTIVAATWIGTAAKLGSAHVMFWLPAVLLFYIPSGIVVAHLAKEMPLEGGIYQWARLRFGPMAGFLVVMNLWLTNVILTSQLSLSILARTPYALGVDAARFTMAKPVILAVSVAGACLLMLVAWRGLALGKWVSTFGACTTMVVFAAVIAVAAPHWFRRSWVVAPVALAFPAVSLQNLNILGKMGFGALSGVDAVAVFAGECRGTDVARAIRRSVWLAAPLIAAMMVLGTASVLTFLHTDSIDLVAPEIQVLSLGAPAVARFFSALTILGLVAWGCLSFNVLIRFPMVAGWDHLLPAWFTRLDPRYRTPVGSVLFAGGANVVFAVVANVGAGSQEAFQFVFSAGLICWAFGYLVMFAIPLAARGEKPPWNVRLAALSGGAMTLLFVALSVFPIVDEQNPGVFTIKMVAVIAGLEFAGVLFYRRAARLN